MQFRIEYETPTGVKSLANFGHNVYLVFTFFGSFLGGCDAPLVVHESEMPFYTYIHTRYIYIYVYIL